MSETNLVISTDEENGATPEVTDASLGVPEQPSDVTVTVRRHDLDALRAAAMLLGIVLHVALSFALIPWVVQDSHRHWAFGLVIDAVHGFRMPLFFLVSGFFTAMLLEKRGIWKTALHRFMRIFVPLVIGVWTLVPLMNRISAHAISVAWGIGGTNDATVASKPEDEAAGNNPVVGAGRFLFDLFATDIFTAARQGDVKRLTTIVEGGGQNEAELDLEKRDGTYKLTALHLASLFGQSEAVRVLAEAGAEVNTRSDDGGTPLHVAAFLGYADVADVLLAHGANPHFANQRGEVPSDTLAADWETTRFIANLIQVPIKRGDVESGREALAPVLATAEQNTPRPVDERTLRQKYDDLVARPIFSMPRLHHLWFLAFLCWLCVGLFIVVGVGRALGIRSLPRWPILTPASYLWVIPLTLLPQSLMKHAGAMFGPDTSAGLLPMPHTLAYYGIFFGFGAWYWTTRDAATASEARLGRYWWVSLPVALFVVFPIGLEMMFGRYGWRDGLVPETWYGPLGQVAIATYTWLMSLGCLGLFRRLLQRESRVVRYISDSSYWLYLAHLPLVIWLQFEVRTWDQPAILKFLGVSLVTTAVLLLSYQILVRHTPIGWLLNGRRRKKPNARVA